MNYVQIITGSCPIPESERDWYEQLFALPSGTYTCGRDGQLVPCETEGEFLAAVSSGGAGSDG